MAMKMATRATAYGMSHGYEHTAEGGALTHEMPTKGRDRASRAGSSGPIAVSIRGTRSSVVSISKAKASARSKPIALAHRLRNLWLTARKSAAHLQPGCSASEAVGSSLCLVQRVL